MLASWFSNLDNRFMVELTLPNVLYNKMQNDQRFTFSA
jgi:hypothetical protein